MAKKKMDHEERKSEIITKIKLNQQQKTYFKIIMVHEIDDNNS